MKKVSKKHGGKRKNAGRKPVEAVRGCIVAVRMTTDEKARIAKIAGKMSVSAWFRRIVGLVD